MEQLIFQTKNGVKLFFDDERYDYRSENTQAVREALKRDMANFELDPISAVMAHNILQIMQNMDSKHGRTKAILCTTYN